MYQALTGGAYQARAIIAGAQRCLNLFVEMTPSSMGEPIHHVHYPTPGLTLLTPAPTPIIRCLWRATTGNLYACAGQAIYYIDSNWVWNHLGDLPHTHLTDVVAISTPVSMNDNSSVLLIGDGTPDGWWIDLTLPLSSQTVNLIDININKGWLGATYVSFQDTFFICNSPKTDIFYISISNPTAASFTAAFQVTAATIVSGGARSNAGYLVNDVLTLDGTGGAQIVVYGVDSGGGITQQQVTYGGVVSAESGSPVGVSGGTGHGATFTLSYAAGSGAFDPLDFAAKSGTADKLVSAVSIHRILWLIGETSYELWQNTGGDATIVGSFPFSIIVGAYGNWGCIAPYSIATMTNEVFWLSQDNYGRGLIMTGSAMAAKRISTYAIEVAISGYPIVKDARGYCYQQQGHGFYVLNFPSANDFRGATWCYDISTNEWSERAWIDSNGTEHRHRANCAVEVYETVVCGDWENANLYAFDLANQTDNGSPIKRLRSFPHLIDSDGDRRVMYKSLKANMQVGTAANTISGQKTLISSSFTAPNGTLLQNYVNVSDINAVFVPLDTATSMQVISGTATGLAAGTSSYRVVATPTTPNYVSRFDVYLSNYTVIPAAGSVYAIARANVSHNGYQFGVFSSGTSLAVQLNVMGGVGYALPLGTIASGFWQLTLSCNEQAIILTVTRSTDGLYLASDGSWGREAAAITLSDATYTLAGQVLIGGGW